MAAEIHGICDGRFLAVRRAFARNFNEHGEVGAAVAVALGARFVVDIWAGWTDGTCTRSWERDTLVNVFSVGKAMAALSVLLLVERGQVDLDALVTRYWPAFGAAGKSRITVGVVLSHRAGLPAIRRPLLPFAMYDWSVCRLRRLRRGVGPCGTGTRVGGRQRRIKRDELRAFMPAMPQQMR